MKTVRFISSGIGTGSYSSWWHYKIFSIVIIIINQQGN